MSSRDSWLLAYVFSDHASGNTDSEEEQTINQLGGTFREKVHGARCPEEAKVGRRRVLDFKKWGL